MIETAARDPRHRVVVDTSGPEWHQSKQEPQVKKGRRRKKPTSQRIKQTNVSSEKQIPLEMQPVMDAIRLYASTMRQCGSMDAVTIISHMSEMIKNIDNASDNPQIQAIIEWGHEKSEEIKRSLARVYDGDV